MDDLISRKALIADLRTAKGLGAIVAETLVRFVKKQPTVDAVEVGHCKGCYYYESSNPGHGYCKYFDTLRIDNDYCSSWERKDNEN